jgi:hypothetical protein
MPLKSGLVPCAVPLLANSAVHKDIKQRRPVYVTSIKRMSRPFVFRKNISRKILPSLHIMVNWNICITHPENKRWGLEAIFSKVLYMLEKTKH